MLLNETYSDWISHFVNQHGYLKSIRKSKLRWLFPCACWSLFDALKHRITQLQRFSTATQLAAQLFGFKFAWCWPTVINNNSNNLYSHNNNNKCICNAQNKSCWHRKFSFSTQITALNTSPDLLKAMFTTSLHESGHRISNTKIGVTP